MGYVVLRMNEVFPGAGEATLHRADIEADSPRKPTGCFAAEENSQTIRATFIRPR